MIQQALVHVLQPSFDPTFSDSSFGFRPRRGAHDAVARAREHIAAGYRWVVDLDLEKFFETLDAWARRKLRAIQWRQWKRPRTRLEKLRQRGVDSARARAGTMNGRGPWWNAGASHRNQAVLNEALRQLGLVSLLEEHQRFARSA